jgi:AcrR family transcriptional regulator
MSSSNLSLQRPPDSERQQIHHALVEVCREDGLPRATIERVIERASVDRPAFDRYFSDLDDCFAQYVDEAQASFSERARAAMASTEDWRSRLRVVIYELARFCRDDEARAHMLLVETLAAGPLGCLIRDQALETMVDLIDYGRLLMDDPSGLTRVTAEAMAGALFNQMHLALEQERLDATDELVPQLMYCMVLPYCGTEAAVDELSRLPLPEA